MLVTGVNADTRTPGYLTIEIDGARFASLPLEAVEALSLKVGRPVGPEAAGRLTRLAEAEAAYRVAVRLLAARPRSVHEMLSRLKLQGHNPAAAGEAVGRLEVRGLLDDDAFARHHVRVRAARSHGRARLLNDLLALGVNRQVAERAIDETLAAEQIDSLTQARRLAEQRAARMRAVPSAKRVRRIVAYLARRGYVGQAIREMIRGVVGDD